MISTMIASLPLLIFFLKISQSQCELIKDPTLKPIEPFSASSDAGIFQKEMKEFALTDRDKLAKIWFHRTSAQREQIKDFYNENYCPQDPWNGYYHSNRCPLSWGLLDISQDSMQNLYLDSLPLTQNLLGIIINEVILDKWKEKGAIEEILCGNDKEMKHLIAQYYQSKYQDTVENQLATFKKDDKDYQNIIQNYCWKGLCQDKKITPENAEKEAQALQAFNPANDKEGFKKKLNELLDKNCEPDMKMILEKYRQNKNDIVGAVEKAFDGCKDVERAYNRLVRYIENTCLFYADELHNAVDGLGTDIDKINRIILTRCERDLACVLNKYKEIHGETFTNRLKTDTTEDRYLESIRYLCGKT